ncbi:MAG: hypothetical protein WC374_01765 [Phycisphaerae bacterium]|jgi:hypothetical protein
MSEVPPVLLSAIICDRVIFDRVTGMPSLINILQVLNSPKFPVRSGQLVFFCELTNGHGSTQTTVRLVDVSNNEKAVFEKTGTVDFKDVKHVLSLAVSLQGVVFEHPGEYRFQILADGQLLGERMILCRQVTVNPPQQGQGPAAI